MKWIDKCSFIHKSFLLGFFISLIGTAPLGYLNVIGLEILVEQGDFAIVSFILGIIIVEFFVLKITSFGARWLVKQKKILLLIEIFTILFLACIALYFLSNISNENSSALSRLQLAQYPLILGVLLNGLNAIQWPYWCGIYIYIFRSKKLKTTQKANYLFITGALIGTGIGMLFFAYAGQYILIENNIDLTHYLNAAFSLIFLILASIQLAKLFLSKNRKVKEVSTTNL